MIAFQRVMQHFQLIVNCSRFFCNRFDWIKWFIAIADALILITFHFVEQRRVSRWILNWSLQKNRQFFSLLFWVLMKDKNGVDGQWYSLIFHTVHYFPVALDPSAVSLTADKTKILRVKNGTQMDLKWTKVGGFLTINFDSCSLLCRSSVCIRSNASSNDVNIVSFSMTVVCSRFSSSFFAFVMIFSSSLRLSKPFMWF